MADVPVPESVMESVYRTQTDLQELRTNMTRFLATCDVDVLAELSPLQRANVYLTLAKGISTLVSCKDLLPPRPVFYVFYLFPYESFPRVFSEFFSEFEV